MNTALLTFAQKCRAGFSLVELLVVIAIIAMLAGLAATGLNQAMIAGRLSKATADARQIGLALRASATDKDGALPAGPGLNSSNDAFRELFPTYLQVEANFVVASSPVGAKADNKIEPSSRVLERGENHWAYVAGLSDTSHPFWPLLVDHTDGAGYYTTEERRPGGTWAGKKAVVVRMDGGAESKRLLGTGNQRYLPRFDDDDQNALHVNEYMGETVRLFEPAR